MEKLGYAFIHLYNRCRELIGKVSPRKWKVTGITLVLLIAVSVGGFLFFNRDQAKLEKEQTLVSELNIILREREKHFETPDDFAITAMKRTSYSSTANARCYGAKTITALCWPQKMEILSIPTTPQITFPDVPLETARPMSPLPTRQTT